MQPTRPSSSPSRWRLRSLPLWLAMALPWPALAEVWQCRDAQGQISFSDRPCPSQGRALDARRLQGNVVDAPRRAADSQPASAAMESQARSEPINDCPGDQELRDMEVRANSRSLGDAEREFMQDEIRRVRQCRKGQGRYSAEDWRISREARAAQSSSNAADARRRAEDMHSAADPAEGERIAKQRRAQQELARPRRPAPCLNGWEPGCARP